jgi:enoyl-[acyl-carrier protein] reductase II
VTGHEAAAHGGDATTFCLVPSIGNAVTIPIIAAGGIADGRGLAAALALGAEGAAMGTRLMATKESPLHENYKQLSIQKEVYDTLYSTRFDGLGCRVLDTKAARSAIRQGLNIRKLIEALPNSMVIANQLHLPYFKLFLGVLASGWKNARQLAFMANAFKAIRVATEDGDITTGVLPVGQATGCDEGHPHRCRGHREDRQRGGSDHHRLAQKAGGAAKTRPATKARPKAPRTTRKTPPKK